MLVGQRPIAEDGPGLELHSAGTLLRIGSRPT